MEIITTVLSYWSAATGQSRPLGPQHLRQTWRKLEWTDQTTPHGACALSGDIPAHVLWLDDIG